MKWMILLLLPLLLLGCSAQPEPTTIPTEESIMPETTEIPIPETTEPETQPPDPIALLLESMTLEEKVGQMLLARFPEQNAVEDAAQLHLGGYILFGRDFETESPDSFRGKLLSCQDAARIPMLMAVDEEGGTVCRVSNVRSFCAEKFQSPRNLYERGGMELILAEEVRKAELLTDLGINVNMAPVCDIAVNPGSFMYARSLGQSPEITGQFASEVAALDQQYGLAAVLKHFPGYGSNADTHTGIAVDNSTLQELEETNLVPFAMGIQSGVGAIMVSHIQVNAMDPELPASLSPVVHGYLRLALGFRGVIVTDDLCMGAIADQYGSGEAAVLAVLAGNDLLCSTDYAVQYHAILDAVNQGRILVESLDASVMRILYWKQSIGLL